MKKTLAFILALCLSLGLCACGKSEEAQNVDDLILSIGEVTLATKDIVNNARVEYERLSDKQKQQVENYHILEDLIESLLILEAEQARIEENYIKMLRWIADNGYAITSDDINNYGKVERYAYTFEGQSDGISISFDVNSDCEFDTYSVIKIKRWESIDDDDWSIASSITNEVYFCLSDYSLSNTWVYSTFIAQSMQGVVDAGARFHNLDYSEISRSTSEFTIVDYEESSTFREKTGYTDVRAVIVEDFFETMDTFAEFLTQKVGIGMNDIGFTSYS